MNELKLNVKLVIDETVEFEASFASIEQKLNTNSYKNLVNILLKFS